MLPATENFLQRPLLCVLNNAQQFAVLSPLCKTKYSHGAMHPQELRPTYLK